MVWAVFKDTECYIMVLAVIRRIRMLNYVEINRNNDWH